MAVVGNVDAAFSMLRHAAKRLLIFGLTLRGADIRRRAFFLHVASARRAADVTVNSPHFSIRDEHRPIYQTRGKGYNVMPRE